MQLPVKLLKEGTDTSQGIPQIVSNINACQVIGEAIKTTLGPRGLDKMIIDQREKVIITEQWLVNCHFWPLFGVNSLFSVTFPTMEPQFSSYSILSTRRKRPWSILSSLKMWKSATAQLQSPFLPASSWPPWSDTSRMASTPSSSLEPCEPAPS